MAVENPHNVPKDQWRKWSDQARQLFNDVYEDISTMGPSCFCHPTTVNRGLSGEEFTTIAWNAAWIAADQLMHPESRTEVKTIAA